MEPYRSRTPDDKARASVAKEFFVYMITKDIQLEDCILDLIDNSIDGARRVLQRSSKDGQKADSPPDQNASLSDFKVALNLSSDRFVIEDNCGGITLADAKDYAFHFGRRPGTSKEPAGSIGLYGIGMKRAIFKIGKLAEVRSCTRQEAFRVLVAVDEWLKERNDWDFPIFIENPTTQAGTTIEIEDLYPTVRDAFQDQQYINALRRAIGRDYAFLMYRGLNIEVNGARVEPAEFSLKFDEAISPAKFTYIDDGVEVEIIAGLAAPLPDDAEPESRQRSERAERSGWYVLCNDRVVLAADKTGLTVWGDEGFNQWHTQYNGFMGLVSFRCADPAKLPWTTTKRSVDVSSPLYRRAIVKMKDVTKMFIKYTEDRRDNPDKAREIEEAARSKSVLDIPNETAMKLPIIEATRVRMVNIQYRKPEEQVRRVAEALGVRTYRDVGVGTFDYFVERELEV